MMVIGQVIAKKSKLVDSLIKWQYSAWYSALFAILCAISGLGNKYVYIPILSVLAVFVLFSIIFVPDKRVLIVPMFMIYYALGTDTKNAFIDSAGDIFAAFDTKALLSVCIIYSVVIVFLFIRLIGDGSLTHAFKKKNPVLYGILILDASMLLGGAFFPDWSISDLAFALLISLGLTLFYIVFYSIITENPDDSIIPYTCRTLVFTCLVISAQVIITAISAHIADDLIFFSESMDRWMVQRLHFHFSWGLPTIVGAIAVIGIPAAMYLARKERFPVLYYLLL